MSDKKQFAVPTSKPLVTKRASAVSASSSRVKIPSSAIKEKVAPRPKFNKNTTVIGDGDISVLKPEVSMPDFDAAQRQIAYGKFLRAMLEECLVDEKIEREEKEMDLQMAQLTDRFRKTMDTLDKTNRRLKEVSFVVEQKRLLDLKNQDCTRFYEMTDNSNAQELLQDLNQKEQICVDKLELKNVDFGYDKDSGHKQLLDAVNEAIDGLEQIKKHSSLDEHKFNELDKSQKSLEQLDRERLDFVSLKASFDETFPKFNEKLIKEASEKISKAFDGDDDD